MTNQFLRTQYLYGENYREKLVDKSVILFGLGGVGGICGEYLVRAGIYHITLVDFDTVDITNLNRQIISTHSNLGKLKTEVLMERLLEINPDLNIKIESRRLENNTKSLESFNLKEYSYVIDAIDDVKSKIILAEYCINNDIPIISRLGAGNKKDLTKFKITDISKTFNDPLARIVRKELRKRDITHLKVCFSDEKNDLEDNSKLGTSPFVPITSGLLIAHEVFKDLIGGER